MGQFLRFALLIILVFIGFGVGVCGVFAIGTRLVETLSGGGEMDRYGPLILGLGVVCLVIAVGCFFGVRALARSLRTHSPPTAPPPPTPKR